MMEHIQKKHYTEPNQYVMEEAQRPRFSADRAHLQSRRQR